MTKKIKWFILANDGEAFIVNPRDLPSTLARDLSEYIAELMNVDEEKGYCDLCGVSAPIGDGDFWNYVGDIIDDKTSFICNNCHDRSNKFLLSLKKGGKK